MVVARIFWYAYVHEGVFRSPLPPLFSRPSVLVFPMLISCFFIFLGDWYYRDHEWITRWKAYLRPRRFDGV
jgi:hypothetical protein